MVIILQRHPPYRLDYRIKITKKTTAMEIRSDPSHSNTNVPLASQLTFSNVPSQNRKNPISIFQKLSLSLSLSPHKPGSILIHFPKLKSPFNYYNSIQIQFNLSPLQHSRSSLSPSLSLSSMEEADRVLADFSPQRASRVTLSPFTPIPSPSNPRRLSSRFSKPGSPVRAGKKKPPLAWVNLQGRLIGADEATSARAIGAGGLDPEQAVAWELFSPIHRVLTVAVTAAAAVKSEKNRQIRQLKDAVQLRDQILMSMQEKLDNLCEQVNIKDQPQLVSELPAPKKVDCLSSEASLPYKSDSICTGCWLCEQHRDQLNDLSGDSLMKGASGDDMFKGRVSISNVAEQEERRMSDLSDWASSSVTSAADIQLNNLAIEQDIYNLKKECEEKDAALEELSTFIRSKDVATSKRIEELEDIIRRKNSIITKLKKDMIVLEQKVVNLTRLKRRSFSGPSKETKQLPVMTDNLIYDMDSPTSPLSSDSDSSSRKKNTSVSKRVEAEAPPNPPVQNGLASENASKRNQKSAPAKISASSPKLSVETPRSRPVSPLKEKSMNQRHYLPTSPRLAHMSTSVGAKNNRRQSQSGSKEPASQKRWV